MRSDFSASGGAEKYWTTLFFLGGGMIRWRLKLLSAACLLEKLHEGALNLFHFQIAEEGGEGVVAGMHDCD